MKSFWWIFVLAIICAVLSKQIDKALAKLIADGKKRAVIYCVVGAVALAVIGVFIYKATAVYAGGWSVAIAIAPVSIFIAAVVIGLIYGRSRNKKQNVE